MKPKAQPPQTVQLPQMGDTREAARFLGRSPDTLKRWRYEGVGPEPFAAVRKQFRAQFKPLAQFPFHQPSGIWKASNVIESIGSNTPVVPWNRNVAAKLTYNFGQEKAWISRKGIVTFGDTYSSTEHLRMPNPINIFGALAEASGFQLSLSPAGRVCEQIIASVGSLMAVRTILESKNLLRMLDRMAHEDLEIEIEELAGDPKKRKKVKKARRRKLLKVPTVEDFESYRGGHTFKKWQALPKNWRCPGCGRSRFELLTWTRSITGYGVPRGQYQWLAPLHEHHDHSVDGYALPPRFPSMVICSDCNHAEGRAKRQLGLPSWFSFSPVELRQFLTGHPHDGVVMDLKKVREIYAMLALSLVRLPATPRCLVARSSNN